MWSWNPRNRHRGPLELKPIPSLWTSEDRNRRPLELQPVATSVIWSACHPTNKDLVLHEIGLHFKRHAMSLGCWIHEQQRIWEAPRHTLPTDRILNLQCLCLTTIHRCYGAVKANFYCIKVQHNAPYMACNVYTYHVCYKDPDFLECLVTNYDVMVYVKYGFHPHSVVVQSMFHHDTLVDDPFFIQSGFASLQRDIWRQMNTIAHNHRTACELPPGHPCLYSRGQAPKCYCGACRLRQSFYEQPIKHTEIPPILGRLCSAIAALETLPEPNED